jgi:hypothetical protein
MFRDIDHKVLGGIKILEFKNNYIVDNMDDDENQLRLFVRLFVFCKADAAIFVLENSRKHH